AAHLQPDDTAELAVPGAGEQRDLGPIPQIGRGQAARRQQRFDVPAWFNGLDGICHWKPIPGLNCEAAAVRTHRQAAASLNWKPYAPFGQQAAPAWTGGHLTDP